MVKKIDKATVMMLIMVGVYLLLWFPLILTSVMLLMTNKLSHVIFHVRGVGAILVAFNSSVNFIIYAVVNQRCRHAYKVILTCRKLNSNGIFFQSPLSNRQ